MEIRKKVAKQINFKSDSGKLLIFILLLFSLWILRAIFIGKTQVECINYVISFVLKLLIFVVYPVIYCMIFYKENLIEAFKFNNVIKGISCGILSGLSILLLGIGYMAVSNKVLYININSKDVLHCFLFAAFFEELCFRGFILEKLNRLLSFSKSNIITSLLFVLIHIPGYIKQGTITSQVALNSVIIIFFISIISGYVFKKSNSLWAVIILHGTYDCVVHMLGF